LFRKLAVPKNGLDDERAFVSVHGLNYFEPKVDDFDFEVFFFKSKRFRMETAARIAFILFAVSFKGEF
jgi:hypothetical protein